MRTFRSTAVVAAPVALLVASACGTLQSRGASAPPDAVPMAAPGVVAVPASATQRVPIPILTPPGPPPPPILANVAAVAQRTQRFVPVSSYSVFLVGAHTLVNDPAHQFLAFHYCQVRTAEFVQCALYDSNRPDANLTGVEYIISGRVFGRLPEAEKQYWHPHNFEILSGQLLAPGLPAQTQNTLMRLVMNSYGKTWHTWMMPSTGPGVPSVPMGKPELAWSFNHPGEEQAQVAAERNDFRPSAEATAAMRRYLAPLAQPQDGVDLMSGQFSADPASDPPGRSHENRSEHHSEHGGENPGWLPPTSAIPGDGPPVGVTDQQLENSGYLVNGKPVDDACCGT